MAALRPLAQHGVLQPQADADYFQKYSPCGGSREPAQGTRWRPFLRLSLTLPARPGERGHGHGGCGHSTRRSLAAAAATRDAVSAAERGGATPHTRHYPSGGCGRGEPLSGVLLDNLLATQNRACERQTGR